MIIYLQFSVFYREELHTYNIFDDFKLFSVDRQEQNKIEKSLFLFNNILTYY